VEIREVHDPQTVELCGQARHLELELPQPRPSGLDQPPAERRADERAERSQISLRDVREQVAGRRRGA
jgi:hypothetical protein